MTPPTNSFLRLGVYTSVSNLVKIDERNATVRVSTDGQTHTRTDAKRFYYLSHAICYCYGADNHAIANTNVVTSRHFIVRSGNSYRTNEALIAYISVSVGMYRPLYFCCHCRTLSDINQSIKMQIYRAIPPMRRDHKYTGSYISLNAKRVIKFGTSSYGGV